MREGEHFVERMSKTNLQLIIGLGNPGAEHQDQRHNAGFWWLEQLAQEQRINFSLQSKLQLQQAKLTTAGRPPCYLACPTTYMNCSGQAVAAIARFYKIPAANILVVHDELDLPPGVVKLKQGGGHAGHNGLRDIIQKLGSRDFWRLRIGIGHPGNKALVSSYVLHKPTQSEQQKIQHTIDGSLCLLDDLLDGQFQLVAQKLAEI